MTDLFTALTVAPWLIPLGLFTVIFVEWSGRVRGEAFVHDWLFGQQSIEYRAIELESGENEQEASY